MFSKVLLLVSLFAAVVVAAPAPSKSDAAPPVITLNSNVSCTSVISPGGINPTPSPTVILLNNPSDVGYAAAPQVSSSPSIINLNAPAPSPPVIKLNRRQFSSSAPTGTFSFGGIVPSSAASFTPLSSPGTPTASSSQSFGFGGIITSSSSSAPASTTTPSSGVSNGLSIFSSKGPDGVETVLLISTATVTVTGGACSTTPAINPALAFSSSPGSSVSPTSSFVGVNVQAPSATQVSSLSIINLNTPPATTTSAPSFAPATSVTPTV